VSSLSISAPPPADEPAAAPAQVDDADLLVLEDALLPVKALRLLIHDGCGNRLARKFGEDNKSVEAAIPGITAFMAAAADQQCGTDLERFISERRSAIASFLTKSLTAPERHRLAILFRKAVEETNHINIDAVPADDPNRARKAVEATSADLAGFTASQRKFEQTPGGARLIGIMSRYQDAQSKIMQEAGEKIVKRGIAAAILNGNRFAKAHGAEEPFVAPQGETLQTPAAGK
jgi:hypothetical protein